MSGPSAALDNLSPARRLLAYGAVLAADAISATATRGSAAGSSTLLVAFANLGDQLRFMNVWSRFATSGAVFDVVCNTPTKAAFELFACVGDVRDFGDQGARSLANSAAALFASTKPFALACVPHPFFSRPIAVAYARTHAARIIAIDGRGVGGDVNVPLERSSWRAVYEAFARACFPNASPARSPLLRRGIGLEYAGRGSRIVALHPASSAPARTLPSERFATIAQRLRESDFEVVVLGSAAEEEALRTTFASQEVSFVCGLPLAQVGARLARCAVFVGIDSSMMQLADSIGVPSVVAYVATSPAVAGPFYAPSVSVVPSQSYAPAGVEPEASWEGEGGAAAHVDVDEILAAIAKMSS